MQPKRVRSFAMILTKCKTVCFPLESVSVCHQVVLESLVPATQSASRLDTCRASSIIAAYLLAQTSGRFKWLQGLVSVNNVSHLPSLLETTSIQIHNINQYQQDMCPVSYCDSKVLELKEALWRRSKTWAPCWQRLIAEREVTDTEALTCHTRNTCNGLCCKDRCLMNLMMSCSDTFPI